MFDSEILEAFKEETRQLLTELNTVVEKLEEWDSEEFPGKLLEEFAGKVDRIMGTAKTLLEDNPTNKGLLLMGKLGELCKATGYKAAEAKILTLIPLFAAFWADTVEVIDLVIKCVELDDEVQKVATQSGTLLQTRLQWLAKQIVGMTQGKESAQMSQIQVDALLKSLIV